MPPSSDRRFKDDAWSENEVFDFIKQSYLLSARYVQDVVRQVDGLDPKTAQKVDFYARQFVDAMSPSNFLLTNPEVLRKTAETGGENLLKGLNNLLGDLERGKGKLRIKMTDMEAFKLGENIGVSPGKVVFQNDLMQLIQYTPSDREGAEAAAADRAALDQQVLHPGPAAAEQLRPLGGGAGPHRVRDLLGEPGREARREGLRGLHDRGLSRRAGRDRAGDRRARGQRDRLLPRRHAAGQHARLHGDARRTTGSSSATFFVTMMDFAEAGELGVFIDEEQLNALEDKMNKRGYLEGSEMATTFNMLRANDLIWSFVVNNYLLGNDPFPFDLLYWNADSTRMPARMHSFYLRKMYQENLLAVPSGITLGGVPIDLRKIKTPAISCPTREDHIAPWKSTYRGTQLLGGPKRFVLAASGPHRRRGQSAGRRKYSHWINTDLPRGPGGVVQGRDRDRRFLVARLAALGERAGKGRRCRRGCRATAS